MSEIHKDDQHVSTVPSTQRWEFHRFNLPNYIIGVQVRHGAQKNKGTLLPFPRLNRKSGFVSTSLLDHADRKIAAAQASRVLREPTFVMTT